MECLPLRENEFAGRVELDCKCKELARDLRLERIQIVRKQEKEYTSHKTQLYRQCIEERKRARKDSNKKKKLQSLLIEKNNLEEAWKTALVETGRSHRAARDNTVIAMKNANQNNLISRQREAAASQRGKVAQEKRRQQIKQTRERSLKLLELEKIKRDYRESEREDAHAMGEVYAARKQMYISQDIMHKRNLFPPSYVTKEKVQQSAVSIEQRFPILVHAQIHRHGAHPQDIQSVIWNQAHEEIDVTLHRSWQTVMKEMVYRINTRKRGEEAKTTLRSKKGVRFLDNELQQLEIADKSGPRAMRLRSTYMVSPEEEENPQVQDFFERVFMSKPIDDNWEFTSEEATETEGISDDVLSPSHIRPAEGHDAHRNNVIPCWTYAPAPEPLPPPHRLNKDSIPHFRYVDNDSTDSSLLSEDVRLMAPSSDAPAFKPARNVVTKEVSMPQIEVHFESPDTTAVDMDLLSHQPDSSWLGEYKTAAEVAHYPEIGSHPPETLEVDVSNSSGSEVSESSRQILPHPTTSSTFDNGFTERKRQTFAREDSNNAGTVSSLHSDLTERARHDRPLHPWDTDSNWQIRSNLRNDSKAVSAPAKLFDNIQQEHDLSQQSDSNNIESEKPPEDSAVYISNGNSSGSNDDYSHIASTSTSDVDQIDSSCSDSTGVLEVRVDETQFIQNVLIERAIEMPNGNDRTATLGVSRNISDLHIQEQSDSLSRESSTQSQQSNERETSYEDILPKPSLTLVERKSAISETHQLPTHYLALDDSSSIEVSPDTSDITKGSTGSTGSSFSVEIAASNVQPQHIKLSTNASPISQRSETIAVPVAPPIRVNLDSAPHHSMPSVTTTSDYSDAMKSSYSNSGVDITFDSSIFSSTDSPLFYTAGRTDDRNTPLSRDKSFLEAANKQRADSHNRSVESYGSDATNALFDKWEELYKNSMQIAHNARSVRDSSQSPEETTGSSVNINDKVSVLNPNEGNVALQRTDGSIIAPGVAIHSGSGDYGSSHFTSYMDKSESEYLTKEIHSSEVEDSDAGQRESLDESRTKYILNEFERLASAWEQKQARYKECHFDDSENISSIEPSASPMQSHRSSQSSASTDFEQVIDKKTQSTQFPIDDKKAATENLAYSLPNKAAAPIGFSTSSGLSSISSPASSISSNSTAAQLAAHYFPDGRNFRPTSLADTEAQDRKQLETRQSNISLPDYPQSSTSLLVHSNRPTVQDSGDMVSTADSFASSEDILSIHSLSLGQNFETSDVNKSDSQDHDTSLEELLSSRAKSGAGVTEIQKEISDMRQQLLDTTRISKLGSRENNLSREIPSESNARSAVLRSYSSYKTDREENHEIQRSGNERRGVMFDSSIVEVKSTENVALAGDSNLSGGSLSNLSAYAMLSNPTLSGTASASRLGLSSTTTASFSHRNTSGTLDGISTSDLSPAHMDGTVTNSTMEVASVEIPGDAFQSRNFLVAEDVLSEQSLDSSTT